MNKRINRNSFTFAEIIVVVAIISILVAIALPNMLNARKSANESATRSILQTISNAYRAYATNNNGNYPSAETELLPPPAGTAAVPYLSCPAELSVCSYDGQIINGYVYDLSFGSNSTYTITATPSTCGTTGENIYTITDGLLAKTAC